MAFGFIAALHVFLLALPLAHASRPADSFLWSGGLRSSLAMTSEAVAKDVRLAFLVKTDSHFYSSRVKWVRESWVKNVDPARLAFVGDTASEGVMGTNCTAHSHGSGLCCKFAQGLQQMVSEREGNYDWLLVIDDDAYVNVPGMQKQLSSLPGEPGRKMLGIVGCGVPGCQQGFCGGGGYVMSKEAARSLVQDASPEGFFQEFMDTCKKECSNYEDIAVAKLGRRRGMEPGSLGGLHGWRVKAEQLTQEMRDCQPEPLTFHYLRSEADFRQVANYVSATAKKCQFSSSMLQMESLGAQQSSQVELRTPREVGKEEEVDSRLWMWNA